MATTSSLSSVLAQSRGTTLAGGVDFPSAQFRDFYRVLDLACRATAQVREDEASAVSQGLSKQLEQLIELQTLEARRIGGRSGADTEFHARYLKAALADELLIHADWAGRPHWRHVLLEAQLFRTSNAGEKVFDEIEQILSQREPAQRPIARLYLSVLSLGFQGRYRDTPALSKIADYRRELFQFIYQRAPDLQGRDRTLSAGAYASTLSHLAARRLPRLSRGWVLILLVLLGLLAVSELLWLWQSWPVREAVDVVQAESAGLSC
jgi:type VI secretion system protein ImpK